MNRAAYPKSLTLVGAGKMGASLLSGWLARGLDPAAVTIVEPRPSPELAALVAEQRLALNPPAGATKAPEILVLAIKPQVLDSVAPELRGHVGSATLVISILAGIPVARLAAATGASAIVRAMPNLPASIGRGATGAYAAAAVSAPQKALADALLRASGLVEWVDREDLIDAVTALSGSGPAYVFHLVECLAQAGIAAGLDEAVAKRLALATVTGAGELLATSGLEPARLRENVTSPGGTTAAALAVLMPEPGVSHAGLGPLMRDAVAAAKRRAGELAG
jgi:pyrroline-5-carboxylate reductase